jgi:hypothetical protein
MCDMQDSIAADTRLHIDKRSVAFQQGLGTWSHKNATKHPRTLTQNTLKAWWQCKQCCCAFQAVLRITQPCKTARWTHHAIQTCIRRV